MIRPVDKNDIDLPIKSEPLRGEDLLRVRAFIENDKKKRAEEQKKANLSS